MNKTANNKFKNIHMMSEIPFKEEPNAVETEYRN
jgi:hypothetical protein